MNIRIQPTQPDTPTFERLAFANDNFTVDPATRAYRMRDTPLDRLHRTGLLHADHDINDMLHVAGQRYQADHFAAGLSPLGAQDYERPIVDGASPKGESDYRVGAYERHRSARNDLGSFFGPVTHSVVVQEQSLKSAGRSLGIGNAPQARAVALDRLREGLRILAKGYGLG